LARIYFNQLCTGKFSKKERAGLKCWAEKFELTNESAAAFELDGEWVGKLPVTFSIEREKLRVVVS
jgi:diacylglycerol kinase family enzyme